MEPIRYSAAACQTDLPNPLSRARHAEEHRPHPRHDRQRGGGGGALPARAPRGVPGVRPRGARLPDASRSCAATWRCEIPNEHTEQAPGEGEGARPLHPERHDARGRPEVAGRRLQHDLPHRARGHPLQVPQGEHLDPLRGPGQPPRRARLRRAALPGGGHAHRQARLRDLLRLDLPGGHCASSPRTGPRC